MKYPHVGATIPPNLGAKLHFGAIRNELYTISNRNSQLSFFIKSFSCRYYARLLAPFILSPLENQRKEANNYEGSITE